MKSSLVNSSPLVRVEDLRSPIGSQRSIQSPKTKGSVAGIGQFPGENLSACPVHDDDQVQVPFGHGNVAEIGCPDLIRTVNGQVPEQVGVNLMPWSRLARPTLRIDRKKPHLPHQPLDPFPVDPHPLPGQPLSNPAATQKGALQMELVDPSRQGQIRLRVSLRP